jgi:hypothetical protein
MPYKPHNEVTLWCSAGNSVDALKENPGKSLALVSCAASACPDWEDGRCCHLERVGKHGRL